MEQICLDETQSAETAADTVDQAKEEPPEPKKPKAASLHGGTRTGGRVVRAKELAYLDASVDENADDWAMVIKSNGEDEKTAVISDEPGVPTPSIPFVIDVDATDVVDTELQPAEQKQLAQVIRAWVEQQQSAVTVVDSDDGACSLRGGPDGAPSGGGAPSDAGKEDGAQVPCGGTRGDDGGGPTGRGGVGRGCGGGGPHGGRGALAADDEHLPPLGDYHGLVGDALRHPLSPGPSDDGSEGPRRRRTKWVRRMKASNDGGTDDSDLDYEAESKEAGSV